MTNKRITRAVEKLLTDDRLLQRFRRKPAKAMVQYRLSAEEVELVRSGDLRALLANGLDRAVVYRKPVSRPLFASMLSRFGWRLAPAALLTLMLALFPATAVRADEAGTVRTRRVRGVRNIPRGAARYRLRARSRELRHIRRQMLRLDGRARSRLSRRRSSLIVRREMLRKIIGGDTD